MPETARVLVHVAQACAELIGDGARPSVEDICRTRVDSYRDHVIPLAEAAIRERSLQG